MALGRKAFTSTRLEEERANDKTENISLKLNLQERQELEEFKELLDLGGDSQAIKLLMRTGRKVILDSFLAEDLRYLVSLKRGRYDGRKAKSKNRIAPKVLQNSISE